NGTTIFTGRFGKSIAWADASPAIAMSIAAHSRTRVNVMRSLANLSVLIAASPAGKLRRLSQAARSDAPARPMLGRSTERVPKKSRVRGVAKKGGARGEPGAPPRERMGFDYSG